MKAILTSLLLLLINCAVFGQYDHFKLSNGQISFERVYTLDSLSSAEIEKRLILNIPKVKDLKKFERAQDVITGKLENTLVNYKQFGGKFGRLATFVNYPFSGEVVVVWKEGKYKVTVSGMQFNTAGFGIMTVDNIMTQKRGKELENAKIVIETCQYVEKYLDKIFLISAKEEAW